MNESHAALILSANTPKLNLDQCITAWLDEKAGLSDSTKTEYAYRDILTDFRAYLQSAGHDLDSAPSIVAPLAQGWAGFPRRGDKVLPATFNQRRSILSSFYEYAIANEVLSVNPIRRFKPRRLNHPDRAYSLTPASVKRGLSSIDRSTLTGKRDYALLSLALSTGRRVSEIANLRYGHVQREGNKAVIQWVRCKGNKQMVDVIEEKTTKALYDYLYAAYGAQFGTLANDAPIWLSESNHNAGEPISARTLQRICERYLGTSKFHATRHTWAVTMHKKGATLTQIGRGLGHSNLKTTSDYMDEQLGNENPYAHDLEDEFGI
jgi:integrase/recombinase XerC